MGLTHRRKQFLEQILNLYRRTHLPVHYETIGRLVGVSKWTAYDMLSELVKAGYLSRAYTSNYGEVGRSSVVFSPTRKTEILFSDGSDIEESHSGTGSSEQGEAGKIGTVLNSELTATKKRLLTFIRGNDTGSKRDENVRNLLDEIGRLQEDFDFCLYALVLLLIYLRQIQESALHTIIGIARISEGPEAALLGFVGAALGAIVQSPPPKKALIEITSVSSRLCKNLLALKGVEIRALFDFLMEALKGPLPDGVC